MTKFDTKIVSTMLLDVMPYTNEKKIVYWKKFNRPGVNFLFFSFSIKSGKIEK